MKLNEYIDKIKAEYKIPYETKDISRYIIDCAHKQKEGNCAVLDDETVKNLIVTYDPSKAPKSNIAATVQMAEIKKEAVAEAKKEEPKAEKPKKEEKQRGWEQMGLGFWNV